MTIPWRPCWRTWLLWGRRCRRPQTRLLQLTPSPLCQHQKHSGPSLITGWSSAWRINTESFSPHHFELWSLYSWSEGGSQFAVTDWLNQIFITTTTYTWAMWKINGNGKLIMGPLLSVGRFSFCLKLWMSSWRLCGSLRSRLMTLKQTLIW